MTWYDIKAKIRQSGLKHTVLNKDGECETIHVEQQDGSFIRDTTLYKYEPHDWKDKLQKIGLKLCTQLDLFA